MADIFHYFSINSPVEKVFEILSTPEGIEKWWAQKASGKVGLGETIYLFFEPDYNWTALVSKFKNDEEFELTMQTSDNDWQGSKVGFRLIEKPSETEVHFYHTGWKTDNEHFRVSNFCWAMYLRILKRNLELGKFIPYKDRLSV